MLLAIVNLSLVPALMGVYLVGPVAGSASTVALAQPGVVGTTAPPGVAHTKFAVPIVLTPPDATYVAPGVWDKFMACAALEMPDTKLAPPGAATLVPSVFCDDTLVYNGTLALQGATKLELTPPGVTKLTLAPPGATTQALLDVPCHTLAPPGAEKLTLAPLGATSLALLDVHCNALAPPGAT